MFHVLISLQCPNEGNYCITQITGHYLHELLVMVDVL